MKQKSQYTQNQTQTQNQNQPQTQNQTQSQTQKQKENFLDEPTLTNRNYKDGVFTTLFKDKSKICELYNALKGEKICTENEIEIKTLEQALYKPFKDDLAFTVGNKLVILVEHQSTPCENMPLRLLIYLARVYEILFGGEFIYGNKLLTVPEPELYVLYNGKETWREESTFMLKLSDAFPCEREELFLEVKTKVIDINFEKHNQILEKSDTLREYSMFVEMVRNYVDNGLKRDKAIEIAIKECIKEDILREFLVRHSGEVYNMIFQEFNLETAIKVAKREAAEDALKLGRSEGEVVGIEKGEAMGIAKGEAIGRVAGRAEGEVVGIEKGIRKLSQTLIDLNIPQDVREKKLYEAYPDEKELVRSMVHEESVKYK